MTFDQIVARVQGRLNLTSSTSSTRIGEFVNDRYRQVVSSVGMAPSIRTNTTGLTTSASRYVTFGPAGVGTIGVIKLLSVYDDTVSPPTIFNERTFDYLRNRPVGTWPPREYAISTMINDSVTIFFDAPASASNIVITADVLGNSTTLDDTDTPSFAENFHDILVFGAMADELMKMEKPQLSIAQEAKFNLRLSELRYFIAKSAYLDIAQGIRARTRLATRY